MCIRDRTHPRVSKQKEKALKTLFYRIFSAFLAPPARLERTTFRLGGGPSIPVSYTHLDSMLFTLKYVAVIVVVANVVALLLATAIESRRRGKGVYRTIYYMPNMISMVIGGYMWMFIFTQVLYYMADNWGFAFLDHSWIGDPNYSFWAIIIVSTWSMVGYLMIIYMAALQGVPADLIESAELAGANSRQCFFRVTLPLIMPAVTICVFWTLNSGDVYKRQGDSGQVFAGRCRIHA